MAIELINNVPEANNQGAGGRSERIGWYLFDFANSLLIMNGGLYFPQWLTVDNGVKDVWFNVMLVITTVALLLTAPVLGLISDRALGRTVFLRVTSAIMFLATVAIHFTSILGSRTLRLLIAIPAFILIMYCYQLSLVFYTALLPRLSSAERYTRISGIGLAAGWIGGIVGVLVVLPFVQGNVPFLNWPPSRANAFLPAALIFGLVTLISLLLIPDDGRGFCKHQLQRVEVYRSLISDIKQLLSRRNVAWFLVAFVFYSDAILTIENNSTIYMERVIGLSDTSKAFLIVIFLCTAACGAIVSRFLDDKVGLWRALFYVLFGWLLLIMGTAAISGSLQFSIVFSVIGVFYGAVWNLSRVIFLLLIPGDRRAESFGIYSSLERSASLIGPLLWSVPVTILGPARPFGYRLAMVLMSCLLLCGIFALGKTESIKAELNEKKS